MGEAGVASRGSVGGRSVRSIRGITIIERIQDARAAAMSRMARLADEVWDESSTEGMPDTTASLTRSSFDSSCSLRGSVTLPTGLFASASSSGSKTACYLALSKGLRKGLT